MSKRQLCIRGNGRKNGIVNRSLQETPVNSFECFRETIMRSNYKKCSKEIIIKVEELYRAKEYEPIYELLLNQDGVVEGWAKIFAKMYHLESNELFSDFQVHLYNMLDGVSDKVYNINMPFIDNLYVQLKCEALDLRDYYNAKKRKDDWNCKPKEELEKHKDNKNQYDDINILMDLENMKDISPEDKRILIGIATGEIDKKDIPYVLNWSNKEDRMKLSRYVKKLQTILND
ncbi:hypothetical protein acsn021_32690 [Anaerocolumna cellulosilytica]|uniref:Uncharacterized protein n=1 Tax=Anaerocolumna cellulosilytica TaxID=433286 RepID=A0A6S6R894_9FIRM|nr:hypothetical protein [Anaerocolumna cellulosilytica]MBB5196600.1 hypothetical protein [Anaerocolumna cellulosilytica]BCJ95700.1 hypothetical protein acsn021_32690 [Anaerocolumna cellulosilytica]